MRLARFLLFAFVIAAPTFAILANRIDAPPFDTASRPSEGDPQGFWHGVGYGQHVPPGDVAAVPAQLGDVLERAGSAATIERSMSVVLALDPVERSTDADVFVGRGASLYSSGYPNPPDAETRHAVIYVGNLYGDNNGHGESRLQRGLVLLC